ncbi:MAG: glucose 1-dehydrogenase [Pseudomonadota bacterium]
MTDTSIKSRFDLEGKVALVTGASKGIGEAIARGMAEFGATVVVSSRKQDAVEAVADALRADGLRAHAFAANVGHTADIDALIERTVATCGGIDIVVNNAATNPVYGSIENTDECAFDKVIDVNLKGPFELCKRAHPILKARGGGSIIHLGSIGGIRPESGIGVYSVSKAAINSMTMAMAQDWGADNIRVNSICPGVIKTKFSEALWKDETNADKYLPQIPLGRFGQPDDVAGLAVFLASDAAAYCSGGVYMVDGGYSAC